MNTSINHQFIMLMRKLLLQNQHIGRNGKPKVATFLFMCTTIVTLIIERMDHLNYKAFQHPLVNSLLNLQRGVFYFFFLNSTLKPGSGGACL